jgi:glycolate oxidase iron-sulfur subunit
MARHDIENGKTSLIKKIALDWLFKEMKHLRFAAMILRLYQMSGWQWIVQNLRILRIFSKKLHELSFMMPPVLSRWKYKTVPSGLDITKKKFRVGILIGCVQDIFFRDINQDTLDVLQANGYEIYLPKEHVCCGSVHGHNGDLVTAKYLAKKMIDIYYHVDVDYIVSNSAGCGAYMREYKHLLQDDPEYALKAQNFSTKVKDITEVLVEHGWRIPKTFDPLRVTYHEPCHLVHTQKVSQQPREMIKSIPNIEFKELPESTWCCGSAGIYNITHYDDSMKILERKMKNIQSTGVSHVLTGNPGCMIQLMYGRKKFNVDVRIMHPISLLKMAYDHEMMNSER